MKKYAVFRQKFLVPLFTKSGEEKKEFRFLQKVENKIKFNIV